MKNNYKCKFNLFGLIFGIISLLLFVLCFFIKRNYLIYLLIILISIIGFILSIINKNNNIIKVMGIILNGLVIIGLLIAFILLMTVYLIFG